MNARAARERFQEADSLYREGRYDDALDRLVALNDAFPNTPNIMFPLARCLRRTNESLALC